VPRHLEWGSGIGFGCCRESPRSSGPAHHRRCAIATLLIGYARYSTDQQDRAAHATHSPREVWLPPASTSITD